MTFIEEKIDVTLGNLAGLTETDAAVIGGIEFTRCRYKNENHPGKDAVWESYRSNAPISFDKDGHAWFRFSVDVPETSADECAFFRMTTGREGEWDAQNPQGMIFVDGEATCAQALDTNHTEYMIAPGKHDMLVYFYVGMQPATLFLNFYVVTKNMTVNRLYYDMKVPFDAMRCLDRNGYEYAEICNHLDRACTLIDFRGGKCAEFYESVKNAVDFMHTEFYGKVCGKPSAGEIAFVGHTHIDVAWLWTLAQTEEKAQRSFSTVITLMEQYPDYVFMSSQPQLYAYVKKNDPELYEKIKQKIREGRWETEGAMWLEADTNLISGESFVRQLLYGKKFMKDEFGSDNRILWLPDVFGYSAALPQILKKCGVEKFFTSKISWCETDKFPHDHFIWQGIDGSELFAVLSDTYVKKLEPFELKSTVGKHIDKKYSDLHISTFGFGDGGGGPTAEMLENYERMKQGIPGLPKVTMSKASDTLARIEENFKKNTADLKFVPKWSGELYLEMHRGTYTSMAQNKKNNRKSEFAFQKAETAASTAKLLTGAEYPKGTLDDGWHTILKNQFHDIIPGSSIGEVYEQSAKEYEKVLADGGKMFEDAICAVADSIKTDGGVLVYNASPFEASGVVNAGEKEFYAENIPAHGYAVVSPKEVKDISVFADEKTIENDNLKVRFDEKYNIVSIYDKANGREVISAGEKGNVLEIYEDYPRCYDAWEITEYYKQKKWIIDDVSAAEVIRRPLCAGIKITRKYRNSVITQKITLKKNAVRLDFETEIDWHEDHVLLKTAFPFDVRSNHANYEIQFGHIERPTHRNTSWDQSKFEVSAHKWADISESDYGVSILNDCKYGYSTEENVMKLSLLKAATYPNPTADRGVHTFTYSVYPHAGTVSQSDAVKQAYQLNMPLYTKEIAENIGGTLPSVYSFVSTDSKNAAAETAKLAEDGNGYIIRVYDCANAKTDFSLLLGFKVKKAYLCDMLENIEEEIPADGNEIKLHLSNFEIKTVRVIPE